MNLTHLRAFHLVATYGSYSGAARAAGLAQPTLSEQVRALEAKYGTKLLQRNGRGVELTIIGRELATMTARLFAVELEAEHLLASVLNVMGGALRIGADAPVHAIPAMRRIRAVHPGIRISLRTSNSAGIRAAVLEGSIDIGIMADETPHHSLTTAVLNQQNLVALVASDSPWGQAKRISLRSLNGQCLVMREQGSVTRSAFESALRSAGVVPESVVETDGREAVHAAVLAGLGVAAIGDAEFSHDPRLTLLDFTDELPALTEFIVYRKDRANDPLIVGTLAAIVA